MSDNKKSKLRNERSFCYFPGFRLSFMPILCVLSILLCTCESSLRESLEPKYKTSTASSSNLQVSATSANTGVPLSTESLVTTASGNSPVSTNIDRWARVLSGSSSITEYATSVFKSPWTWRCVDGFTCRREMADVTETRVPLDVCWLNCGTHGPMWPYPTTKSQLGTGRVSLYPQNVEIASTVSSFKTVKAMLGYAGNNLLDRLYKMGPKSDSFTGSPGSDAGKNSLFINLTTQKSDTRVSMTTDESYTLLITTALESNGKKVQVDISSPTYFGARHALETLSQLIVYDEENDCLQIVNEATIQDRPAFRYRGLMIDTARNFIPMTHLRKMVDAMSYNKMNVLHWHITDTNSFPFYSKRIPQMTKYGAYSPTKVYTPKEVKDLILYARLRGIKILPELDAPAHAGNGWQWGPIEGLGELAHCVNQEPWRSYCGQPPCGQLNPLNNYTYIVLGELYKDMLDVFDKDMFHMGGDEVFFQCWYYQKEIREWQRNRNNMDLMELWGEFQDRAFEKLIEANGGNYITPIVWTSDMTTRARQYLNPADYIIQIWTGSTHSDVKDLLQGNYRVIFSNVDATYLDHGYGTWLGHDHFWTIKTWQNLYDNDLLKIAEYHLGDNVTHHVVTNQQILGGEATLWAEKVDEHNMEMKLWPRSAAFAERLWSNPRNRTQNVYPRLIHHRDRMVRLGVHADRLQPESCHQINGYCNDPYSRI